MTKPKWEISCFGWIDVSAVYCVCTQENGKTVVHYIGQSQDIGKRLTSLKHPYRTLMDDGKMPYIKFKEDPNYVELEKQLIRRLKPPLNKNLYGK